MEHSARAEAPTPTVTVAIPSYNRARTVGGAIDSALRQTYRDYELLVLDDGSTDDTADVVAAYDDPRLRYERNPTNIGMKANWNRAFELARGRYVSLLHDDDRWMPHFLENAVAVFESSPDAGFVYAASRGIHGQERKSRVFSSAEALDRFRRRPEVGAQSVLVRRDVLLEVGGFQDRWPYSMDWQVWMRIAARYPVGYLAEPMALQGEDDDMPRFTDRMNREPLAIAKDKLGMLSETIPGLPIPEADRTRLLTDGLRSLAQAQMVTAWGWAARGDRARGRIEADFGFAVDKRVGMTSPHLVAAAYTACWLMPPSLVRWLDRFRGALRPAFRRD